MALVFISHSSVDNEKTEEIAQDIKGYGIDIFLDFDVDDGIEVTKEWESVLYEKLKVAHVLVILISPAWIKSNWCQAEYRLARYENKEIIPIIIDHGKDGEVNAWIEEHIQNIDYTTDTKALTRAINKIKKIALDTQQGFEWDSSRAPYIGLRSFSEQDAAIFFGRQDDIKALLERLNNIQIHQKSKFINIVAASGLGKSSLLKAGVIPHLKRTLADEWMVLPVRRLAQEGRPLYSFAKMVAKVTGKKEQYKRIFENLKSDDYKHYLDDIVTDIENLRENEHAILLPIDQAEEFYSLSTDIKEREYFFRALEYLLSEKKNFFLIWTLRSDYLKDFQLDTQTTQIHKLEELYSLNSLAKENITAIIKNPAKIKGIDIEESLVEKLKDVHNVQTGHQTR